MPTKTNTNVDGKVFYKLERHSTGSILFSFIPHIILYLLIKKYTDDLLSDPNCNCVLEKYISDLQKTSLYLVTIRIIGNILRLFHVKPIIIIGLGIVAFILYISLIINWLNITKNIKKNKCKCANTMIHTIITIIIAFQIIVLIIPSLLRILSLILRVINIYLFENKLK